VTCMPDADGFEEPAEPWARIVAVWSKMAQRVDVPPQSTTRKRCRGRAIVELVMLFGNQVAKEKSRKVTVENDCDCCKALVL